MSGLKIVSYIWDANRQYPGTVKVLKILDWPTCFDITPACAFLGICVYYHIWIENFAIISALINLLFRKNTIFIWGPKQQEAMDILKVAFTTAFALVSLNYSKRTNLIILGVDSSLAS